MSIIILSFSNNIVNMKLRNIIIKSKENKWGKCEFLKFVQKQVKCKFKFN